MTPPGRNASAFDWPGRLEFRDRLRSAVLSRAPSAEDGRDLADVDFARIALITVLPERAADMGPAICEAGAAGAAGVLSRVLAEGEVGLSWPDGSSRRLPLGAKALDPGCWLRSLACALTARDQEAVAILTEPSHVAAAQIPADLADDFWPLFCSAIAAAVREPASALAWLDDADGLLAQAHLADPQTIRFKIRPLSALVRALLSPNLDFGGALAFAVDSYRELYARREPSADPAQLLALEALGLAA